MARGRLSEAMGKEAAGPQYRGRDRDALFSTGVERANIAGTNEVLDGLFARKAEMARRTEGQLKHLLHNPSYGRVRALGPTAAEAGRYFETARGAGLFE